MNHEQPHRPHADLTDTLPPIADPTRRPDADVSAIGYRLSALPLLLTLLALALLTLLLVPAQAQTSDPPVAPQTLTLSGPTSGEVDERLLLEAQITPAAVTWPVTYTVTATDLGTAVQPDGDDRAQITLAWSRPGTKAITITAANAAGAVSAHWTIVIAGDTPAPPRIAPQTLTLSGPLTGTVDTTLTLTASVTPASVTPPVTYTVTATDLGTAVQPDGDDRAQITLAWSRPGTKAITVTAENEAGVAHATWTLTIQAPDPEPERPEAVAIRGTLTGTVGVTLTLTAWVTRTTASDPLTYTWQPVPLRGQGTATAQYRFAAPGRYPIMLTVANGAGQAQGQVTVTIAPTQTPRRTLYLPLVRR